MKIDYHLEIIKQKRTFVPNQELIKEISNSNRKIFEITGSNGTGKTFLLNLIAYAFYSEKLDNHHILASLRESLNRFSDEEYYDLTYNIEFNLPNNKTLVLKKEKNRDRLVQFKDEPPMHFNNFSKKFTVLYDIPTDPTKRLDAVIKDLGIWNSSLSNKINKYWEHLRNVKKDFNNVKDQNKIDDYNLKISKIKDQIDILKTDKLELENNLQYLISYENLQNLSRNIRFFDEKSTILESKKQGIKKIKKPIKIEKKDESKLKNLNDQLENLKSEFDKIILELITIISSNIEINTLKEEDMEFSKSILAISNFNFIKSVENTSISEIYSKLDYVLLKISNVVSSAETSKNHKIFYFLEDLIKQIDGLIEIDADAVIKEITNVGSDYLKNEIRKRIDLINIIDYKAVKKFIVENNISKIKAIGNKAVEINQKIDAESKRKDLDSEGLKYFKLKKEIEELDSDISKTNDQIIILKDKCSQALKITKDRISNSAEISICLYSLETKIHSFISAENVKKQIIDIKIQIDLLSKQINENEKELNTYKTIFTIEDNKSESIFTESEKVNILNFEKHLSKIVNNLVAFNSIIDKINQSEIRNYSNQEDKNFIKIAGKIIAHSMDNKILGTNGNYIRLDYYDIILKEFHCENDEIIRKDDISTGLASGNYLKQRIENIEGDYVIILLDEIGNMDSDIQNEVIKSIKKIESQNRLLVALLTRPNAKGLKINTY